MTLTAEEQMRRNEMRERIIVALDTPDAEEAYGLCTRLRGRVPRVKVGMTLFYAYGPQVVVDVRAMGFGVFVDLKLHDIPHQIRLASATLARLGADMITVHASGGAKMVHEAVLGSLEGAAQVGVTAPRVVAVTVLTSMNAGDVAAVGVGGSPAEQVERLAVLARDAGAAGVVCSPQEAARMRELLGPAALVVTPGIRPEWAEAGDQARVATPAGAAAQGASHLVIGRPVTAALDPVEALERIVSEG